MAHALLDHSRTRISAQNAQNAISSAAWIGSIAMDIVGLGGLGSLTRAATNVATVGSQFFLMNPWGRDQELEADRLGMMIIHWAGYDISQIPHFWQAMSNQNSNEHDFFSTHPADSKRIAAMNELIVEIGNGADFHSKPVIGDVPTPKDEFKYSHLGISGIKYCQNCGAQASEDDKFCINCGTKFDFETKCSNCGADIGECDKFCTNCGNKLRG